MATFEDYSVSQVLLALKRYCDKIAEDSADNSAIDAELTALKNFIGYATSAFTNTRNADGTNAALSTPTTVNGRTVVTCTAGGVTGTISFGANGEPTISITGGATAIFKPTGLEIDGQKVLTSNDLTASLTETTIGKALDATAGKELGDLIAAIKEEYVKSVEYDDTTGDLLFTLQDNSEVSLNVLAANFVKSITYDADEKELVITRPDNSAFRVPLIDLVDIYTGFNGDHIQINIASGNVIKAILKAGTITDEEIADDASIAQSKLDLADILTSLSENTTTSGVLKKTAADAVTASLIVDADVAGNAAIAMSKLAAASDINGAIAHSKQNSFTDGQIDGNPHGINDILGTQAEQEALMDALADYL
jgi:hypothetical protein